MNDAMEAMIEEAFTIDKEANKQPTEKQSKAQSKYNGVLKKIRIHMDKEAIAKEVFTEKAAAPESLTEKAAAQESLTEKAAAQESLIEKAVAQESLREKFVVHNAVPEFTAKELEPSKSVIKEVVAKDDSSKVIKAEQIIVVPLNPITIAAPKVSKKYFNVGPSYVPSFAPAGSRVVGSASPSDLNGENTLGVQVSASRSSIPGDSKPIQLDQDVQVEYYKDIVVPGTISSSSRNILKPVLADTAKISLETSRNIDETLIPGTFSSNSDSRYLAPNINSEIYLEEDLVPGSFSSASRNIQDLNNPNQRLSSEEINQV